MSSVSDFKADVCAISEKFKKIDKQIKKRERFNRFRGTMKVCGKPYRFCFAQFTHTQTSQDGSCSKELRLLCASEFKYCLLGLRQKQGAVS